MLTKSCTLTKKFRDGVCLTVIHYQLPFQPKPMHLSLSLRNQFRIQILKSSRIFRIYAGDYCMCRFTQYPKSVGHFPFSPNTRPMQALFIHVATAKKILEIYKAGKRHQLRGARQHVKILIFTSMAMLSHVLLMSNPKGIQAWATSFSSITPQSAGGLPTLQLGC